MIGTAGLKGLRVDCIVGVYAHERKGPQTLSLDVEVDYDIDRAVRSDSADDVVDYARVAAEITELLQRRKFVLLETLADETARMVLEKSAQVQAVRLEVRKPAALSAADCSFVRLALKRH